MLTESLAGLIPSWTKRNPDYGSMMKTINCRDDSLVENRGLWNSMKHRKRCIIVAQGFYEWLKKNNGKEKIPHFVKRKDGQLMCFAGLWDCVKFEGTASVMRQRYIDTMLIRRCRIGGEALHLHHHHNQLQQAAQVSPRPHARNPRQRFRSTPDVA